MCGPNRRAGRARPRRRRRSAAAAEERRTHPAGRGQDAGGAQQRTGPPLPVGLAHHAEPTLRGPAGAFSHVGAVAGAIPGPAIG
ncbi:hypothetical protein ACFVRD_27380 [Streptomyces sp. NPDC057908]|uniref:hypothetical protein n=1 Tax=Streptomyces sp. NPDC057908 TaxID=3346276 RepID=UPI0036EB4636